MRGPTILLEGDSRLSAFAFRSGYGEGSRVVVGWREWVSLPELGIARVAAKIDTGARTSALHADRIELDERAGGMVVRFHVVGEGDPAATPRHEAPLLDRRMVRSSNGESELRCVIRTLLVLAGRSFDIELTLTNRAGMELPMLIGRAALAGQALVDPEQSWTWERPRGPRRRKRPLRGGAA